MKMIGLQSHITDIKPHRHMIEQVLTLKIA